MCFLECFFSCIWSGDLKCSKISPLLPGAAFTTGASVWCQDRFTEAEGISFSAFILRIFTEHRRKPAVRRSRISPFPCPASSLPPYLGFIRARTYIPDHIPKYLQRKACCSGISSLAWGSVWRMCPRSPHPGPWSQQSQLQCFPLQQVQVFDNHPDSE